MSDNILFGSLCDDWELSEQSTYDDSLHLYPMVSHLPSPREWITIPYRVLTLLYTHPIIDVVFGYWSGIPVCLVVTGPVGAEIAKRLLGTDLPVRLLPCPVQNMRLIMADGEHLPF